MSRIAPMNLTLLPSPSADTVSYRMYFVNAGDDLTEVDPHGNYISAHVELDASLHYNLADFTELAEIDGVFDVGFTSIDNRGNESEMGALNFGVPFDFLAPAPPAGASFGDE